MIYWIILFAFILRIGLGFVSISLLPIIGYESKTQKAGYLFFDAYRRDSQAWDLAQSTKPLQRAFDSKFSSDQYGGLLWVSAFIYRYLSGGTHQPFLIILLAAFVNTLGVFFVFKTGKNIFPAEDDHTALFAAMIFAFFPEAILLSASQMREPFLITLIAMAFYGLTSWQITAKKSMWLWILISIMGLLFISPGFVILTLIVLTGWIFFTSNYDSQKKKKFPWQIGIAALGLFFIALIVLSASWDSLVAVKGSGPLGVIGNWARGTAKWNTYLLGRSSGIVQLLFQSLPSFLAFPFVALYGILQPVLPAAIFEPGNLFWKILGVIRASGWYLLLPLIAFSPFAVYDMVLTNKRKQFFWLVIIFWGWVLISALRGGGDQWDNPRYRTILMVWSALLAAVSVRHLLNKYKIQNKGEITRDHTRWFWRIIVVELIILLVFGHWYTWRYLGFGVNIGIRNTIILAISLSGLYMIMDIFYQRFKASSRL